MIASKPMWWHLIDRAYKMMEQSGYRLTEHDPDQNDPIGAWMSDARVMLRSVPDAAPQGRVTPPAQAATQDAGPAGAAPSDHNLRLICEAIADTAKRMGIYNGEAPLDGPQFIGLLADMTNAFCAASGAKVELLAIHEAVMNPMAVKIAASDTYTLKRVKEFILRAVGPCVSATKVYECSFPECRCDPEEGPACRADEANDRAVVTNDLALRQAALDLHDFLWKCIPDLLEVSTAEEVVGEGVKARLNALRDALGSATDRRNDGSD